jgi:beta-glucanase (GH16 family)
MTTLSRFLPRSHTFFPRRKQFASHRRSRRRRPAFESFFEQLDQRVLLSTVYVSDLPYVPVTNGWGPVEKNMSNGERAAGDGHTLTLHGVTYAKGLGVHPNSEVDVPLKGAYSTFVSDIGIDDEVLPNRASPVDFQVWADGVKLFDSGTMTNASATQHVNVDVTGRSLLALKVIYTGSTNWYDHTDWAGAQLLTTPTPTPTPTLTPTLTLPSPISGTNYQLVWSDEFNGTSVDASKWNKVGPWGHPTGSNWANFSYLTSNVSEANGVATITAQKSGSNWTGGILSTDTTKQFQYGFVEVRAKLPKGQGFWPAIWLYGGTSADELDMMEFLGRDVSTVYQSYHFGATYPGGLNQAFPKSSDWTTDYHLFQMKWEPGRLTYYIDNVQTGSWTQSVPARPMYLMLNFDVGGSWPGYPDSSTPPTAAYNVDYVRVYQRP